MNRRIEIPTDSASLILARKNAGMSNPSIGLDEDGNIDPSRKSSYTLSVRKSSRSGPKEQSSRAKSLKTCKGLKGCEFVQCAEEAMGKLPANLQKLKERCRIE